MSHWNAKMYVEPPTQRLAKTTYDRPSTTITDTLQNDEDMLKKLEGYEEVDMLERVQFNTHVRYITLKDGIPRFCLGGLLKRVFEEYVVLSNGKLTWSVQRYFYNDAKQIIFTTKFYKYMSKDRLNSMVNDENSQEIQRLKEENDQLKSALQHQSKQSVASKKSSQEPKFF
jgi:hypothetical protein